MNRPWKTDYKLCRWSSPEELVELLNKFQEEGWRTELSRVYYEEEHGEKGWTIFSKSYQTQPPLLDAEVKLGEIYSILNSTEVVKAEMDHAAEGERGYTGPTIREIDRQIKALYKQHFPDSTL